MRIHGRRNEIHVTYNIVFLGSFICCQFYGGTVESVSNAVETHTYRSKGVIRKIDLDTSMVTIHHEDIPGYMPPMEMTEDVVDVNMLKAFRVGDIVEFDLERSGSDLTITNLAHNGFNRMFGQPSFTASTVRNVTGQKAKEQRKTFHLLQATLCIIQKRILSKP